MLNSVIDFGKGGFTWGIIYLQLENQQNSHKSRVFPIDFPTFHGYPWVFSIVFSGSDPVGSVGRLAPLQPADPVAAAAATLGGQEAGRRRPSAGHGGKNGWESQPENYMKWLGS